MPLMRSCSPTTPEPTITAFEGSNLSLRPRANSLPSSGHACRWSKRVRQPRTSCGPSSPSTGQAPGAVFQKLTSQVALAFLGDYPTPQSAALLGEGRMRQFCRRHSYRGGKSPAELVGRLRIAPVTASPVAPQVLETIVRGSIAQISLLNTEIAHLERALADALAAHPKTPLLKSLPRVANVSLAALIAEIGPLLERCENVGGHGRLPGDGHEAARWRS